jgi:hypothetical protein
MEIDSSSGKGYNRGMANYAILHVRRIKSGAHARHLEKHCKRDMPDEQKKKWQLHPENEKYNGHYGQGIIEGRKKLMEKIGDNWIRKPQKNASYCLEMVITSSKNVGPQYLEKAFEWVLSRYEVLFASVHWDETTPHIHAYILPVVREGDLWRYSSDAILGKKKDMERLQDDFWADVGRKFGLDRGLKTRERERPVRHSGLADYRQRQTHEVNKGKSRGQGMEL